MEQWKLNSSPEQSVVRVVQNPLAGRTFEDENGEPVFSAPYVQVDGIGIQTKLQGEFREVSYEAIIGSRVRVYSRPDLDAPVLTRLSMSVEVDYPGSINNRMMSRH